MIKELIEDLKHELSKVNPKMVDLFEIGANEDEIKALEKTLNCQLPEELKELYLTHNGQKEGPGLFFDWPFLSLKEMEEEWKVWRDIESSYKKEFSIKQI